MIKDYLNKYAYFLFSKGINVNCSPNPLWLVSLQKHTFLIIFLFFLLSLVNIGPIEKCLTELKTPNVLPGEREDIKGQVRNTVIDSSEEFLNFFLVIMTYHTHTQKTRGLVEHSANFSAALGCLRAPPDFSVWVEYSTSFNSKHTIVFAAREISFF